MADEGIASTDMPEDLGIRIGTKAEALWERIRKEALILIEQSENSLIIQREMMALAERKIKEEQERCTSHS